MAHGLVRAKILTHLLAQKNSDAAKNAKYYKKQKQQKTTKLL